MSTDLTTFDNLLAAVTVTDGQPVHDPATGELVGNTKCRAPTTSMQPLR